MKKTTNHSNKSSTHASTNSSIKGRTGSVSSKSWFSQFAKKAAYWAGTPYAFLGAFAVIVIWAVTGPIFDFNDTWQLVINTSTTIVTFLMVFLIQNAQNRDSLALQIKLDELIRSTSKAHNSLMDLEELEEKELDEIRRRFLEAAAKARHQLRTRDDIGEIFNFDKDHDRNRTSGGEQ